jgi:hypothetical protein
MEKAPSDIYIKLTKKGEDHFVKRIIGEDDFDKSIVGQYEKLKLKEFYVPKEFRRSIMASMIEQSTKKLEREQVTLDEIIESTTDSYNIVKDLVLKVGFDENTIKLAKTTISTIQNSFDKKSPLGHYLKKLLDNESTYAYQHSMLISIISRGTIKRLEWGEGAQLASQLEKMIMVSLFHDIKLEDDALLKISSQEELTKAGLIPYYQEQVLNHANEASTFIKSFPGTPIGVDVIIRQHHGTSNGIGFPETFSASISPMAIAFIVIEKFVELMLNPPEGKISLKEIFNLMTEIFPSQTYRKIIKAIKESIIASLSEK